MEAEERAEEEERQCPVTVVRIITLPNVNMFGNKHKIYEICTNAHFENEAHRFYILYPIGHPSNIHSQLQTQIADDSEHGSLLLHCSRRLPAI